MQSSESLAVTSRRPPFAVLAVLACVAGLAGCLGNEDEPPADQPIKGGVLTVYSSLPAHGPSAALGRAVAAGQRLALADADGRAGRYRVRLVRLTSSKPVSGNWDPGQVSENASRAARDPRAIAYLGELNLGASAVSVPVTNDAGMLQVSPGDGLTSLTEEPPRSAAGPERYFPSGRRSFLRLVPADIDQAGLIVERLQALGAERPAVLVGSGVYARELATEIVAKARAAGIPPVETKDLRDDPEVALEVPRELAEAAPDAVVLALARDRYTPDLLAGLGRALPQARLLSGSGVLVGEPMVAAAEPAALPLEAVAPEARRRPGAAGRRILERVGRSEGADAARPEALWGYESVRVVLDAIRAAQGNGRPADRAGVIRQALAARVRRSPIGTYEVRRTGAVEGLPVALYRLEGDRFEFVRTLR
ncbi:MAG: branched-chain amino acid transport system substrate-binding protein [Thermoleophilaceae bacterium]|jgi:branched-chain amino acid transport system substrate-binding protein|nr:branched-chain amino acid transport system substrate-binding protein [Thermoleophilaceae bacterium]